LSTSLCLCLALSWIDGSPREATWDSSGLPMYS
jgi:hypothetical protein